MKIAIIGAAGGIGSVVSDVLSAVEDIEMLLIDDLSTGQIENFAVLANRRNLIKSNFLDLEEAVFGDVDIILLLCAVSSLAECQKNATKALTENLLTTSRAIELAVKFDIRIIFSSTSAVYEENKSLPFSESMTVNPNLVYSNSKFFSERLLLSAALTNEISVTILRFFNVFGPRQDVMRINPPLVNYLVREIIQGKVPKLYAGPNQGRDYVYVNDIAELLLKVICSPAGNGEIYNVCSGKPTSIMQILGVIERYFGHKVKVEWGEPGSLWDGHIDLFEVPKPLSRNRVREETQKNSVGDPTKCETEFGWKAKTDVLAAIELELPEMERKYREKILRD